MPSRHVAAAAAGILAGFLVVQAQASTLEAARTVRVVAQSTTQPRDPRPNDVTPPTARERALQSAIARDPANIPNLMELAKLQEERRAYDGAERTYLQAVAASGGDRGVLIAMSGFYNRRGQFEPTMAALQAAADKDPTDAQGYQLVAVYYFDKANKDATLAAADKLRYADAGIAAADWALANNENYTDALTYKNLLLRIKANLETDPLQRAALIAEADLLRNRAIALNKRREAGATPPAISSATAPPLPPVPPDFDHVDGMKALRIGGNIKTPVKIHHASPIYPQAAQDAQVSGMVILEAVIDTEGNVRAARILRSIPLLDQAALDAVRQWRFAPTLVNGSAAPVIMTVTVNFTLE